MGAALGEYGWDIRTWYGQAASAALAVFALAFVCLIIQHLLVARYEARRLVGEIDAPALRTLDEGVPVLGANVGDVPDNESLKALQGALRIAAPGLPWQKALVRRTVRGTPIRIVSLFFPVNNVREAFALCTKLADIPPVCAPQIATSDELTGPQGRPVTEDMLARFGVAPHEQKPAFAVRSRVVIADPRSVPSVPSDNVIWLSAAYAPDSPGIVRVVAAGDTMMGSSDNALNPDIKPGVDAAALVGAPLAGLFRKADIAFVNLEGPLYDGKDATAKACTNCFAFRSPTRYADVLASLGVDVVSMANNHSGDFGEAGRVSTMAALRSHDIAFAGLDRDGARTATLKLADGRTAALIAFAPNHGTLNLNAVAAAAAMVRQLKREHTLVIVSFHGGAEGWTNVHVPKAHEIFFGEDRGDVMAFAHAVIDAGADLVIGHGPHVPRAVEIYKDRLIAYSLGNFWTYNGVVNYAVSGLGPVLEAYLAPDGTIAGVALHSSRQAGLGVPRLDPLDEAARYVLYLTRADFPGTAVRLAGGRRVAGAAS